MVITDLEMPEKDGIGTTIFIREYEKQRCWRKVPIIGLTGQENEKTKKICLDSGMNLVLPKPIKKIEIENALKTFT